MSVSQLLMLTGDSNVKIIYMIIAMVWMFVGSQESHVRILTPNVTVLEVGTLGGE